MAFDTFDEGIAPGGLRSKHEIKILICYLYSCVGDKISKNVILESIMEDGLANFFEVSVAFDELVKSQNLEQCGEADGEQAFILTQNGKMIAEQLEDTLALTVKGKALSCAVKLLAQRKTARENTVELKKTENGYDVLCTVSGGSVNLLEFKLYAPNLETAELMKKNFLSYPSTVYKTMLALMAKDRESVGEALEEIYANF